MNELSRLVPCPVHTRCVGKNSVYGYDQNTKSRRNFIYIWSADEEIEPFLPDLSAESTDSTAYTANPTPYQA